MCGGDAAHVGAVDAPDALIVLKTSLSIGAPAPSAARTGDAGRDGAAEVASSNVDSVQFPSLSGTRADEHRKAMVQWPSWLPQKKRRAMAKIASKSASDQCILDYVERMEAIDWTEEYAPGIDGHDVGWKLVDASVRLVIHRIKLKNPD